MARISGKRRETAGTREQEESNIISIQFTYLFLGISVAVPGIVVLSLIYSAVHSCCSIETLIEFLAA